MISGDLGKTREYLSTIKDPFNKDNMVRFSTYCARSILGGWYYHGTIEFQNGNTKGEQKFEAADYHSLLLKMETFINEELI